MKKPLSIIFVLTSIFCLALPCESAELLAEKAARSDAPFSVIFKAVGAPDLAGIKVVLTYDASRAKYQSLKKASATKSMMHVVNDKNPGQLIIVMASATGQQKPDFELFTIDFERLDLKEQQSPFEIKVSNVEMMSAALVEIPCPPTTFRLD